MRLPACLLALAVMVGAGGTSAAQKRIALSFDDVPRQAGGFLKPDQRAARLIAGLRLARVPQAAFFVNPCRIGSGDYVRGAEHIADYADAGHAIANHGCTHLRLADTDADAYLADLDRAERWLKGRKGHRVWFRYPYLNEGSRDKAKRDAVRAGLTARGLTNGYVTAEASDWYLEQLASDAVRAGKRLDRTALRDLYVESHVRAADFADALMQKAIGRRPIHVMLLHETDIAALYIVDLVRALRADGWQIVTADAAYADPVAIEATRYDTPSAAGTLTEMLAWQKGLPAPRWYERNEIPIANALFAKRVLKEGQ